MTNNLLSITIAPEGGYTGIGTLGKPSATPIVTFANFISSVIGVMTVVAFIWFTFVFISGAISVIGSGGDKQALETAKKKITTGIIGLVITVAAIFAINLIGQFLGIKGILNVSSLFSQIQGK